MDDRPKAGAATNDLGRLRASIANLQPFHSPPIEHDARAAGITVPIRRLNLNESAFPPSPRVIAAIRETAAHVHRYPDPRCRALAAAVATRTGLATDRIVFGNGSDELLMLLGQLVLEPGASAVLPTPSFPRYRVGAIFAGATVLPVAIRADGANDPDAMLAAIRPDTRMVLCATPNNPTGAMLTAGELADLANSVPKDVLLVVDEAYFEFARHAHGPDALSVLANRRGPWAVARTFSKAYGLAGLRIGYALLSSPALAEAINRIRGMFNVDTLAQVAALAALEDEAYTRRLLRECAAERQRLADGFRRLGCPPLPSVANFVSAQMPMPAVEAVKLLMQRGILVGIVGPAPFERHIRVTVGTVEDNDAILAAVDEIVKAAA